MRSFGTAKKNKAVKIWHTRAMLINPNKTRITITWIKKTNPYNPKENLKNIDPEPAETTVTYHPIENSGSQESFSVQSNIRSSFIKRANHKLTNILLKYEIIRKVPTD
jgi:hypothetical protein